MGDKGFGDGNGLHLVTPPQHCDCVVYLLKIVALFITSCFPNKQTFDSEGKNHPTIGTQYTIFNERDIKITKVENHARHLKTYDLTRLARIQG